MAIIFDGKAFAANKEKELSLRVIDLFTEYDATPRLVSFIIGTDPASILYQNLKKKAAERIAAQVEIIYLPETSTKQAIIKNIEIYNKDNKVNGIMIQLPLPKGFSKEDRDEIINSISLEKDIDGLRKASKFTPPTAKAVSEILNNALSLLAVKPSPFAISVVGATGFIGRQIVGILEKDKKYEILELNSKSENLKVKIKNSDVVITVTGKENLVSKDMIKPEAVLIDVGAPKGDIEKSAYEKASFVSPVPGGVGPVTISSLMENLVLAAELQNKSL